MTASLLSKPVTFPENVPILGSKWWRAEQTVYLRMARICHYRKEITAVGEDIVGSRKWSTKWCCCVRTLQIFLHSWDKGTRRDCREFQRNSKDSSQCQDMRRFTNLKGFHYESVVEEVVFANCTCWVERVECNCGIVSHWRAYTISTCIYIYIHTFP